MSLKLKGELGLDGSGWARGLAKAGEQGREFANHTLGGLKTAIAEAFTAGAVIEFSRKTMEMADNLINTAKRLDATVEQVQLLSVAAKDAGTSLDTVASAFEKIDIARAKALSGDKKALAAFTQFGINSADLKSQTAATLFTGKISDSVKSKSVEELGTSLKEIMGKAFGESIPLLKTDFEELQSKLKSTGQVLNTDMVVRLKLFGEELSVLGRVVTAQLAPALLAFAEWAYRAAKHTVGMVAGDAAFWGTVYQHMESMTKENAPKEYLEKNGRINLWKALHGEIMGGNNGDALDAKEGATAAAEKPFVEAFAEFQAKVKKLEGELDHPRVPNFGNEVIPAVAKTRSLPRSDSIVSVGNFLGQNSGAGVIVQIAQKQLQATLTTNEILRSLAAGQAIDVWGVPPVFM